jgi:hypothetical protein
MTSPRGQEPRGLAAAELETRIWARLVKCCPSFGRLGGLTFVIRALRHAVPALLHWVRVYRCFRFLLVADASVAPVFYGAQFNRLVPYQYQYSTLEAGIE